MNPVAVAATATNKATHGKMVLVANVFVDEHPPLVGAVRSTQKDPGGLVITTEAKNVKFVWDEGKEMYLVDPSSTLKATWDIVEGPCETHAEFTKHLTKNEGSIVLFELGYFPTGATTGTFTGTAGLRRRQARALHRRQPGRVVALPRGVDPQREGRREVRGRLRRSAPRQRNEGQRRLVPRARREVADPLR